MYESADKSVVVVDIPRSIEEAQELLLHPPGRGVSSQQQPRRRLISAAPIEKPWDTPEPGQDQGPGFSAAAVAELMTLGAVRAALDTTTAEYAGPWCLPRVLGSQEEDEEADADGASGRASTGREHDGVNPRKRKLVPEGRGHEDTSPAAAAGPDGVNRATTTTTHNNNSSIKSDPPPFIPPGSRHLQSSISAGRSAFLQDAPVFDLIVLDPPWPSRSARRKRRGTGGYGTTRDMASVRALLRDIPIDECLGPAGLVAVWVTNKPAVADLMLGGGSGSGSGSQGGADGGLFAEWGLEPVAEWIWLKITASGEPVVDLEARWRKPWEKLLIARRRKGTGQAGTEPTQQQQQQLVRSKVILAVPDVHSRKPNLRGLFAEALLSRATAGHGEGGDNYAGLEVFARNLTAGWWAWGDEALSFQQRRHWVVSDEEDGRDSVILPTS